MNFLYTRIKGKGAFLPVFPELHARSFSQILTVCSASGILGFSKSWFKETAMNRAFKTILIVVGFLFPAYFVHSSDSRDSTLWDNGDPNFTSGISITGQALADDFELPVAEDLNHMTLTVLDTVSNSMGGWDGVIRWWIYDDDNGLPGNRLSAGSGRDFVILDAGVPDFFVLGFELGRVVHLEANSRYWIAVHLNSGYSYVNNISWAGTATATLNFGAGSNWGTDPWESWVRDFSFQLEENSVYNYLFTGDFESEDLEFWDSHSP